MHRSKYYYQSRIDDGPVIHQLEILSVKYPTKGFADYYYRIRRSGFKWNHKKVKRVYDKMELNIRRKHKRRLPERIKQPLCVPLRRNESWSMDFMQDRLINGRKLRTFNLIDDFNREVLTIEIDTSLTGERVRRILERVIDYKGKPKQIRSDNGPEFICDKLNEFLNENKIEHKFIQPGKPTQNAYIERFNRTYRKDVLNAYLFESIDEVKLITEEWMEDYNHNHSHKSLGKLSPIEYAIAVNSGKLSPSQNPNAQFTTINSNDDDEIILIENAKSNKLNSIFNQS